MRAKFIHFENDLHTLLDELVESAREGEIVQGPPPTYESFEFVKHDSDLTHEFAKRAMALVKQNFGPKR